MVLLFEIEISTSNGRAALTILPFLLFSFYPSNCLVFCPQLSDAAESLLSLQASAASVKDLEWMRGFRFAQLFLNALGCRETDRKFSLHQLPLHLHRQAIQASAFPPQWEVLCGKAEIFVRYLLPNNHIKSLTPSCSFIYCLIHKSQRSVPSQQVNTWVMTLHPHVLLGSRCFSEVGGPNP